MKFRSSLLLLFVFLATAGFGKKILIPMDEDQANHLKAYLDGWAVAA